MVESMLVSFRMVNVMGKVPLQSQMAMSTQVNGRTIYRTDKVRVLRKMERSI